MGSTSEDDKKQYHDEWIRLGRVSVVNADNLNLLLLCRPRL